MNKVPYIFTISDPDLKTTLQQSDLAGELFYSPVELIQNSDETALRAQLKLLRRAEFINKETPRFIIYFYPSNTHPHAEVLNDTDAAFSYPFESHEFNEFIRNSVYPVVRPSPIFVDQDFYQLAKRFLAAKSKELLELIERIQVPQANILDQIYTFAHQIKGMAGCYGLLELENLSVQIEALAKESSLDKIGNLFRRMNIYIHNIELKGLEP